MRGHLGARGGRGIHRQQPLADPARAFNNLGVLLYKKGRIEDAEAAYREALRRRPDYPVALSNLFDSDAKSQSAPGQSKCQCKPGYKGNDGSGVNCIGPAQHP